MTEKTKYSTNKNCILLQLIFQNKRNNLFPIQNCYVTIGEVVKGWLKNIPMRYIKREGLGCEYLHKKTLAKSNDECSFSHEFRRNN